MDEVEETDPNSTMDTDLYKLTMHYAIWCNYPGVRVSYRFVNRARGSQPYTRAAFECLEKKLERLEARSMPFKQYTWLRSTCPFLPDRYIEYLHFFHFLPHKVVTLEFHPIETSSSSTSTTTSELETKKKEEEDPNQLGDLHIKIEGLWIDTILYEVPLLSMISEAYYETVDRDWTYEGQEERAMEKARKLLRAGCLVSEFGTRRRRSWKTQFLVIKGFQRAALETGMSFRTSNVWMAYRFGLKPIGTIAHEFIMAEAAMNGYQGANQRSLDLWTSCFHSYPELFIALSDTFTTKPFFEELIEDPARARLWKGVRHDSGDPKRFVIDAKNAWQKVGIDPKTKLIVFSDGLDVDKCLELHEFCKSQGVQESFGIGTHLTNDFDQLSSSPTSMIQKSPPLNIVIKLVSVNGKPCVKLSDDPSKAIGPKETIEEVKNIFGIHEKGSE